MEISNKLNIIVNQYEKNKLSHAFLIETNNIEKCLDDVKEIIKIINKDPNNNDNNIDKLIDIDNLPSLVIISPDKNVIKKSQLEELEYKFATKPIYTKYNNYIILNADTMNASSGNTILKFLEEPQDYIIGFLIVNNKENVLPTIKSRCEIIHVDYDTKQEIDANIEKLAKEYIKNIKNENDYLINKKLLLTTISERSDYERLFRTMFNIFYDEYHKEVKDVKMREKLNKVLELIQKKLLLILNNVNIELILDSFVIEMRRIYV